MPNDWPPWTVAAAIASAIGARLFILRPSRHFTWDEATTTTKQLANTPGLVDRWNIIRTAHELMEPIRAILGNHPIRVTSWFRSPAVNEAAGRGGARSSDHMRGTGVDFYVSGMTHEQIVAKIYRAYNEGKLPKLRQAIVEYHDGHTHVAADLGRGPSRHGIFLQTHDGLTYQPWAP